MSVAGAKSGLHVNDIPFAGGDFFAAVTGSDTICWQSEWMPRNYNH